MNTVTVCIPTMPARHSVLSRLLFTLQRQPVDVLIADGVWPMGDKLNVMFRQANTPYVVAVDDDDLVTEDFGYRTYSSHSDFVGYRILYTEAGRFGGSVAHRGDGDTSWATFERGVSPKCLIATDIARAHPFGNHYTADREWSAAVQADLATFEFINAHLYHYDHWDRHMLGTTPDAGRMETPQRDVGMWPYDPEAFRWV